MNNSIESRYAGSLLGLAVGNALGAPVEFMKPGTFKAVSNMQDCLFFLENPQERLMHHKFALMLAGYLVDSYGKLCMVPTKMKFLSLPMHMQMKTRISITI